MPAADLSALDLESVEGHSTWAKLVCLAEKQSKRAELQIKGFFITLLLRTSSGNRGLRQQFRELLSW